MTNCRAFTLYSGSGGNSFFFSAGGVRILIDAGRSARFLSGALCRVGERLEETDAIFITHAHTDHVSALPIAAKSVGEVHITAAAAFEFARGGELPGNFIVHKTGFVWEKNGVMVRSFSTSHDAAGSVCYRIDYEDGGRIASVGFATDTGYVTEGVMACLNGCSAAVIESNHDENMLRCGPYPYFLKKRIASELGHLSNTDCGRLLACLADNGMRNVMLAHLSRENNTPEIALKCAVSSVNSRHISLTAASQTDISVLI